MPTELVIVEEDPTTEEPDKEEPVKVDLDKQSAHTVRYSDDEWEDLERGVGRMLVFVFATVGALLVWVTVANSQT